MKCEFCDLPEIKKREIVRNDLAWAFPSNRAVGPCHILIVPKRCVAMWDELSDAEQVAIFQLREKLNNVLQQEYGAEGFNYAWNEGRVAGQSVPHFHMHIIPRKKGDTGIIGYDPRSFLYRPEQWEELSERTLRQITKKLKYVVSGGVE